MGSVGSISIGNAKTRVTGEFRGPGSRGGLCANRREPQGSQMEVQALELIQRPQFATAALANRAAARPECVRTPFSRPSRTFTPAAASLIKALITSAVGPRRPSACQSSSQTSCASQ